MLIHPMIGMMLYGYCEGYFGRDSYGDKRIEAVGVDWLVVRACGDEGKPDFRAFDSYQEMCDCVSRWNIKKNDEE